ncbi:MAG: hypothetical protein ACRD1K_20580 [Acidimicrobiales bacterium]
MSSQLAIPTLAAVEKMPLEQVLSQVYPAALAALDGAIDAPKANEVRSRIEAVVGYVNRALPREVHDRQKRLSTANRGNRVYLEASRRAGQLWALLGRSPGRPRNVAGFTVLSPEEAGFADRWDARRCVKAGQVDLEDVRTYLEECDRAGRQYTLTGLVGVYDLLNPSGEADVEFSTRPLAKFLSDEAVKVERRMSEAQGEVKEFMKTAVESLRDAGRLASEQEPEVTKEESE